MNYLNTRTVSLFTFWLILLSVFLHAVNKNLLGLYPEYDLTSPFVMTVAGSFLLVLPSLITGKFQPLMKFHESQEDRKKVYNLKSLVISVVVMVAVATAFHYSGVLPLFDLESALFTLWIAGIIFLALIVTEKFRDRKKKVQTTPSGSVQEGGPITET